MKFKKAPELRFPEFQSEWHSFRFGEYVEERIEYPDGNLPLYSLTIENGIVPKTERYERSFLVKSDSKSYKLVRPLDFAFNPMNLRFGALALHKEQENVIVSKYYNIFYLNDNGVPRFFEYYLTTHKMIQFYEKMATGTLEEKKRVHYSDFVNFKKPIPSKTEQQKIADFLSSVDQKIQQLRRKKELLDEYKKGVMQKLFSKAGDLHPELRFKKDNGDTFQDWEIKTLGDISSDVSYGINSAATEYDGKIKYLRITDIDDELQQFKPNPLTSPSDEVDDKFYLKSGDLVLTRTGASTGKCYMYRPDDGNLVFAGFLIKFSLEIDEPAFIFYYTFTKQYKDWIKVYSARSGQPGINSNELKSLKLSIPPSQEQTKIVSMLNSIQKKIEITDIQINKTQIFKEGLLQKMFV